MKRVIAILALIVVMAGLAGMNVSAAPNAATTGELRATLGSLLTEHVALATSATGGALGGRPAQFEAAAAALDANSIDVSKAIGSVYGAEAEAAFLPLWRKHIGFVVDYTTGLATDDTAKSDQAVQDLLAYAGEFAAFLNSANPNIPADAGEAYVKDHILTLKAVIDAQKAGDPTAQFTAFRQAFHHMDGLALVLAGAIGKQFPDKFTDAADSPSANLRAALTMALQEHVYLAARATGAAIGGRQAEFEAAAAALDGNSVDLSKAIGSIYGAEAEAAFLPLWRKHIGFVVDYTTGLATDDTAKSDKAVQDLLAYADEFAAFLNSANPNLPTDVGAAYVKDHILTLKSVIDAQKAGDQNMVYGNLRTAYGHMVGFANPLTDAIVKQFPDKFGTATTSTMEMPHTMPATGMDMQHNPSNNIIVALLAAGLLSVGGVFLLRRTRK